MVGRRDHLEGMSTPREEDTLSVARTAEGAEDTLAFLHMVGMGLAVLDDGILPSVAVRCSLFVAECCSLQKQRRV